MSRRHLLMLLALASLWGASFMFIKICVRELAPTTLVCLRLGIGSLVLAPFAFARLGLRRFVRETRSALGPRLCQSLVRMAATQRLRFQGREIKEEKGQLT